MTVSIYPVFVKGQTLTDDDLNELRDSLHVTDQTLGRLVGFGINCGLTGTINGNVLRIESGLAVDQLGEAILLAETVQFELPEPAPKRPPDFLEPDPGGFTPVLTVTEVDVPAVACNEAGCEGHARQRRVTSQVQLYAGRLSGKVVDFSDEPLLKQEPILVRKTSTVNGPFIGLRNAIVERLGDRLEADAKAKLAAMTIDADLPAIQGFKAGFLNQVFFAALDLLRCERLTASGCSPTTGSVGVALGWAHQDGTTWTWDCAYRHDWQVPAGQALAFLGGRCVDPCDIYRDQINAMINAFEVPVTPAKADPPPNGGKDPGIIDICLDPKAKQSKWMLFDESVCGWVKLPPPDIDLHWTKEWVIPDPDPGPIKFTKPDDVYGTGPEDLLNTGKLGLERAVGYRATDVAENVTKILTDRGIKSDVRVVTPAQAAATDGYAPSLAVSPADSILLSQDAQGKVIAIGSIPATYTLRSVSTDLPQATAAAGRAEETARSALETAGSLGQRVAAADLRLDGLGDFQKSIVAWQSSTDGRLGGLQTMIATNVGTAVNDLQLKVFAQVDDRVGEAMSNVRTGVLEQVRVEIGNAVGAVKADVTRDLQVTSDAIREEAKTSQVALSTQVSDVGGQVAGWSRQVEGMARQAERSNARIDEILVSAIPGGTRTRTPAFDREFVAVLGNMRSSIMAAATPAQREKVRTALADGDVAFARIETASAAGTIDLVAEQEALGSVLVSMTSAVEAAGAPAPQVEKLRSDTASMLERIRG